MNLTKRELAKIIKSVKTSLEAEMEAGVQEYFLPNLEPKVGKAELLTELREKLKACRNCELYKTRRNFVFGSGSAEAKLVFVGEAPGEEEDRQGEPFVGKAGELLTRIIESIGHKRKGVYICNVLRCRPPGNRNPLPHEVEACERNLQAQIRIIRPKVICALGKFAAQTLLKTEIPISGLRGKFHDYHGIKLMPTFHPAYLLRNPKDKRLVWEDMKKVRDALKV